MKVEQLTDPGGHVGPPGSLKKKSIAGLDDSDSGLDTTSTSSDSARSSSKVVEQNDKTKNHHETVHEVSTVVVVTRKKPPFMGLALKRNPDLSEIARNEQKLCYECYECGSKMAKRQPLTKTNGILFMKNRESEIMEYAQYKSVDDQAYTRSEIVQSWHYELQDHREYCLEELNQMYFYQKRYNQKYAVKKKNVSKSPIEDARKVTNNGDEKPTAMTKLQKKLREKIRKSKFNDTKSKSRDQSLDPSDPSVARSNPRHKPSCVISRPLTEENTDINFSGILQSTVLRQHCEQCVLRNKPVEYQNVLFVCQL